MLGDIVITTRGTVGNTAHYLDSHKFECMRINSGMAILRCVKKRISNDYLALLFKAPVIKEQIELLAFGTAQPQLTVGIINHLQIPLPSLDEQRNIVEAIASVEDKLKSVNRNHYAYQRLKKALMQDLLTGKVRVTPDPE